MSEFKTHAGNTTFAKKLNEKFNVEETCKYLRSLPTLERVKERDTLVMTLMVNTCSTSDEVVGAMQRYILQIQGNKLGRIRDFKDFGGK